MSRWDLLAKPIGSVALVAGASVVGTQPGPAHLVRDINTTPTREAGSSPEAFVELGAITLFTATTPETGLEIWRTDGTEAGTFLVKDIRPGAASSQPSGFIALDGAVFFHADDGIHGRELWRTDGTTEGTTLVKDIRAGSVAALLDFSPPGIFRGRLFFTADDGIHGPALWASDGTAEGTVLVADVNPTSNPWSGVGSILAEVGGALLFTAGDELHGFELWRTDGTEPGTRLVKDIRPGPHASVPGGGGSWAFTPVELGGVLYFQANDGTHGLEVWKSDGTEEGTVLVKDIDPDPGVSFVEIAAAGGWLYVVTDDGVHGTELWRSDGTEAGTVLVKDIAPGPFDSRPSALTEFQGRLFFQAFDVEHGHELWMSDGTEAGTVLVKDIRPGSSSGLEFAGFGQAGGNLFFVSDDGVHGLELWKTDGSEAGTVLVRDLRPGLAPSITGLGAGRPFRTGTVQGMLLFGADEGLHGHEPWRSDGTPAGTALVKDVNPFFQTAGAGVTRLGVIDGVLFFGTTDGVHGTELWRTDGTETGTFLVKDVYPGRVGSQPSHGVVVAKTLFFVAADPEHGRELWKTDGTESGTVLVRDIAGFLGGFPLSSNLSFLSAGEGLLFFRADDGIHGIEPWRSDGTYAGTFMIRDIEPGPGSSQPTQFVSLGGVVVFGADSTTYGTELWRSDGTEEGTFLLADINPGPAWSLFENNYTVSDDVLFFPATDGIHGFELFRTDGSEAGTFMLKDIHPASSGHLSFRARAVVDGTVFFVADEFGSDAALWKTDGTEAGTVLVKSGIKPAGRFLSTRLASAGGMLFFNSDDGVHGVELWRSDGTEEGTVMVKDIHSGAADSIAAVGGPPMLGVNGILFFVAEDGSHGLELWRSDGTEEGTFLARDIRPGVESSSPAPLMALDGTLFFRADDGVNGLEPWRSDGTEHGTAMIQDIAPGPRSSRPSFFLTGTIAGTRVPFQDDDGVTGLELWAGRAAILAQQPRRAVADLRSELGKVRLPIGLQRALGRALDQAASALAGTGGETEAIVRLERFAHHVDVLSPRLISDADRENLVEFAQDIVAMLERLDAGAAVEVTADRHVAPAENARR